jgi:hypothetical protein
MSGVWGETADLHLHSAFSDGTWSPEELAGRAVQQGLRTLALTDHDTMEGCPRMGAACGRVNIEFIPGTELTAEAGDAEVHLLAYHADALHPELSAALAAFQRVRQERVRSMVERLNGLGVPLRLESVEALAKCRSPGRPHVARALVAGGFCATVDEGFERYLKRQRPAWVPKFRIAATEAIRLVHRAGGVAVLAHPGLSQADPWFSELLAAGLDGVECYHPKHDAACTERYLALAREHGLLVTGGSDCHGMSKGQPSIGTVRIPRGHAAALGQRAAARRGRGAT